MNKQKTIFPLLFSIKLLFVFSALIMAGGCKSEKGNLAVKRYPNMKLGFTTQNFIGVSPVSIESSKEHIDYALKEGYKWIELRDPDAELTEDQCRQIAQHAEAKGIEVVYSAQRGFLDEDFIDVFTREARNAAVFDGPRFCRALAANSEFSPNQSKLGWNEQEFNKVIERANQAAAIAGEYGLKLVVENSNGDIDGNGAKPYYGFAEFLDNTDDNVLWQFDTANFFWVPQAEISPEQVEELLNKYAHRLSYLHLKSAKDGKALPVIDGNPLDFEKILSIAARAGCNYIAIELDVIDDKQQVYENHSKSLEYLIENKLVELTK